MFQVFDKTYYETVTHIGKFLHKPVSLQYARMRA